MYGCGALAIIWRDLAEVRSVAVHSEIQKNGWGKRIVEACLSEALTLGIYRVFVLTYEESFFLQNWVLKKWIKKSFMKRSGWIVLIVLNIQTIAMRLHDNQPVNNFFSGGFNLNG